METEKDSTISKLQKNITRLRITAGMLIIFCFILLVYALVQKGIAQENQRVAYEYGVKLDDCAREAMRQRDLAQKAAEEAVR